MFNLREFIINNLIKGVKNKSFSKEYASILATNYFIKGILSEKDIMKFDAETTEIVEDIEEITETVEENTFTEESTANTGIIENTEATEVAE